PLTQLVLGRRHALLQSIDELVAPRRDRRVRVGEAAVESMHRALAGVRKPLGHRALGPLRDRLDRALDLARESLRGVLARALDRICELRDGCIRMLRRRALDDTFEALDESSLDVGEHGLDALKRLRLLAFEGVAQLLLPPPLALGELVERLAPLDRVGLKLGARARNRMLGRA